MKRRDFLKKLGIVCGAAVACPIELLKGEPKQLWMQGKNGSFIEGEKPRWRDYHASNRFIISQQNRLVIELEREFWNTKFKSPFIMLQIDP